MSKFDISTLNVASLNFTTIRQNLITFLQQYPEFAEYDLSNPSSASGLFINILAANTAYNGFYLQQALANSFVSSATNKKSLLLLASNLGILIEDSVSSRTSALLSNSSSEAIPQYSTFTATSSSGVQINLYNRDEIPASSEITTELISGFSVSQYGNFDLTTQSLLVPYDYDPTTIVLTVNDETWTYVDSTTNVSETNNIFSIINGIDGYIVTTNIEGSNGVQNDDKVIVYTIKSTGNIVSDVTITSTPANVSASVISTTLGHNSRTVEFLKTLVVNTTNCKNRLVTEQDYKDVTAMWLTDNGVTTDSEDVTVSSPSVGTIRVYAENVSGEIQGNLLTYLDSLKMAGTSVEFSS